jgi:hypothetical protein
VHFNSGGQNVGNYDATAGNAGGQYRAGSADIYSCSGCGFKLGSNTAGEWYKYNVNVRNTGNYNVGFRYTSANASQVRFKLGSTYVSGVISLPATGGYANYVTHIIENVNLNASGNQTLTLETVSGDCDVYHMEFKEASNTTPSGTDNWASGNFNAWYFLTGPWTVSGGVATLGASAHGKMLMGDDRWTDYSAEVSLPIPNAGGNGGILFRAQNASYAVDPPNDNNPDRAGSDYVQGYYVGLQTTGVVLGKQNYDWTGMTFYNVSLPAGSWHRVKAAVDGKNIKIYLDNMTTPIINIDDNNAWVSGAAGIRAHNAANAQFHNFIINGTNPLPAPRIVGDPTSFSAAPNPVDEKVTVTYIPNKTEKLSIFLIDLQGRVVKRVFEGQSTENSVNRYVIDRKGLASGTYFLRAVSPSESRQLALVFK